MPTDPLVCLITAGCERGHHPDTPCGKMPPPPGSPCEYCGDPLPDQGNGYASWCRACCVPMTIPMMKAFAADQGWDTTLAAGGGRTDAD